MRTGLSILLMMSLLGMVSCGDVRDLSEGAGSSEKLSVPERKPEFLGASEVYGPLTVRAGEFTAEAEVRPWSAWWLPTRETYLFRTSGEQPAPLQKYDLFLLKTRGQRGSAAAFEEDSLYDPGATGWEGRCDAWALASVMEPEPSFPVIRQGITFGVGDLKALLVKKYEKFQGTRIFGQRYNGDRRSVYDDLYADQFHLLMNHELFARRRPFVMDKDPGVAVWNTPVWKAQVRIAPDDADPLRLHVTAWLFGASPFVESYDYVGTLSVAFEYTYDLFGIPQDDGDFLVTHGEWTGASLDYHPDFFTVLPDTIVTESLNKELDITVIDQIVRGN